MKKTIYAVLVTAGLAACSNTEKPEANLAEENVTEETIVVEYENFGDSTFAAEEAIASTELMAFMGEKDSVEVAVKGTIEEVCQKKGCWMSVPVDDGSSMHVTYNYEFLLPLNSAGREFVMNGFAYYDTIPVSHLKHLAEDAGKSQEEIDQITEPKATLAYLATGVKMKK